MLSSCCINNTVYKVVDGVKKFGLIWWRWHGRNTDVTDCIRREKCPCILVKGWFGGSGRVRKSNYPAVGRPWWWFKFKNHVDFIWYVYQFHQEQSAWVFDRFVIGGIEK